MGGKIMTIEELELESFRQIREKVSNFCDESSNDEIAGFVKGIVNLEKELYEKLIKEVKNKPTLDPKTLKLGQARMEDGTPVDISFTLTKKDK